MDSLATLMSKPKSGEGNQKSYASIPEVLDVPNLIQTQINSFEWFKSEGLGMLFNEVSPIQDFDGGRFELTLVDHKFQAPKYSEEECRGKEITYSAPLYVTARLLIRETGEIKEQRLFMGDVPMMTAEGTFVINGAERVVVSQLVRSPGAYFTTEHDASSDRDLCFVKLIPYRGAWLEFETSSRDVLSVKVDRRRRAPVITLLRALGLATEEELKTIFKDVDTDSNHQYMTATIDKDVQGQTEEEALIEFYRRLRPGEPPNAENAKNLMHNLFFNPRRYDLGNVGRYKLNKRLGLSLDSSERTLTKDDFLSVIRTMIMVNNGQINVDDIDHLGNRRIRAVGELLQNQLRIGFLRMERVVRERMTTQAEPESATPASIMNVRPVVAAVREFFGGSQLSQFMDQTNPLAELTHKRRLSALGPGGLSRERAGFDVRDVHHSHYGRICPIETPEGPNIGLLGSLATYARTNQYGFIETPYRKVIRELPNTYHDLKGRIVTERIVDDNGKVIVRAGKVLTTNMVKNIEALSKRSIKIKSFASTDPEDIVYLAADDEENESICQANSLLDDKNQFVPDRVEIRRGETFALESPENVNYMDISPIQIVSVSAALIPFLEHDDANRALMGSNMQRQAVPLLVPEAPLVGTGMERRVATDSGQVMVSSAAGVVVEASADRVVVLSDDGETKDYKLTKFLRSNQGTCMSQRPIVNKGDLVTQGQPIVDSSSTDNGELALGQNVLVAFMSWEGYNFEDAIILSEDLLRNDKFTSIHIEKFEVDARDTKLGPEEITKDISNVGDDGLRNLDEEGVIYVGAEVKPGDILVGKITPKGETELTAEEKLLRAIFGEKARDVKDTSLRVPHGERGKVIDVKVLSRENKDELPPGVNTLVRVWVAQTRKISEGDKMAGRHGNKGVISRILPAADMPYLLDGTPVDIILNPIGVPSRMNLGQILETHMGRAAQATGVRVVTPVFDGANDASVEDALARAWIMDKSNAIVKKFDGTTSVDINVLKQWLNDKGLDFDRMFGDDCPGDVTNASLRIWFNDEVGTDASDMSYEEMFAEATRLEQEKGMASPILGKSVLYDGKTGERYAQPVTVGNVYMMKLIHLVEDKIHARSTGPYSLITQQPLGGKAQFGGQRFGEMEVWALESYSAAYNLQEMLTVKSDDVVGRVKTYEAIIKGEDVVQPGVPESFHVLIKELQSLGLSVELLGEENQPSLEGAPLDSIDEADDADDLFSKEIQEILEPSTMTNEVVEKASVLEDPDNTDDPSDLDVTDYPIEGEELENDTNSGL
jgi:DNA-directed RNA polymerase subunit beta